MSFEIVTIISLVVFMVTREIIHFLQVTKLQELLKSVDITEYYKARGPEEKKSPSENIVMEENDISKNENDLDIRKISEVIVDGEKKPIKII